ncbi:TetM/TetW/TetO/TetS family tetracycline resistance ribosomal protection protein [Streptomyces sp. G44]|nr:TetM/TetW/TetO/TetS family tetracycline resistance ribosomal protection protein [Streptomyces sp. G44]
MNLGILAHIDAGKTSLTERLLHTAGVIDEIGRVDDGNTQTDSLALERQRGITIKSAVVSFTIEAPQGPGAGTGTGTGVTVNLIDTPGHPDFIAEVERVLSVLDGAVLVISAVEGVQAQTRVLLRTLRRLRIPTLIFVNKADRTGARYDGVLRHIAERLTPDIVPMGTVTDIGTRAARFTPFTPVAPFAADGTDGSAFTARLAELLTGHDDALLTAYVDDAPSLSYDRLRAELARQTGQALVHPVYFGSATTGAGVPELKDGIRELLPSAAGDAAGPLSGSVFKVERGSAGEKIAYVRVFSGTVRTRDRVAITDTTGSAEGRTGGGPGARREGKVTAVSVCDQGTDMPGAEVRAGQIGKLWGLGGIRIGDVIGVPPKGADPAGRFFAPPTLETVVTPLCPADRGALHVALTQFAEQDPLIDLRQDTVRQEVSVSLYGEVQKEVVQATLAEDFGLDVSFRETTTICVERVAGTGEAFEIGEREPNPFLATVGLRVEPAPAGTGVTFRLGVELGSMPYAFFRAVEETVRETLHQGLYGWRVPDCAVTMTRAGYWPRQSHAHGTFDKSMSSTAGDFRNLTPLVLMDALREAGTVVHEPMHRFRLDVPADTVGAVLPALARLRAVPHTQAASGTSYRLEGDIPAQQVHALEQRLPGLTRGEGELESAFDHYEPVRGPAPTRERTDHDPLHRKEYLLRVVRRTPA